MMTARFVITACLLATGVQAADQPGLLRPFLKSYCVQCHGPEKQKGDRRFDMLTGDFTKLAEAESFQEILDQLNLAEMPPKGKKQPTPAEVKRVVAHLTQSLARARESAHENSGKGVLRRLNRAEYRNTVRDLFDLRMIDFDPTTTFPPDDSLGGFDNVGEGLVTSGHLLHNYLEAARKVADKAIRPGPEPQMIRYEIASKAAAKSLNKDNRKAAGRMFIKFRQPLGISLLDKKRGVPAAGEYVIRLSARAIRRESRYKDEDLRYNSNEPMRLSISIDSRELGATAHRIIGEYEIPDDQIVEFKIELAEAMGAEAHLHITLDVPVVELDGQPVSAEDGDETPLSTTKIIARIDGIHFVTSGENLRLGVKTHLAHFFDPDTGLPLS